MEGNVEKPKKRENELYWVGEDKEITDNNRGYNQSCDDWEKYHKQSLIDENKKYRILMQDYNPVIPFFAKSWKYLDGLKARQSEINHISYLRQEQLKKEQ